MKLFLILNFIYFILSSFAWPSAFMPDIVITIFGILIYLGYFMVHKIKLKDTRPIRIIIGVFLLYMTYNISLGVYSITLKYIPAILLCLLNSSVKRKLLQFITKWYGILMIISLILYGITFMAQLPSVGKIKHYIYDPFINYIFYLRSIDILKALRFNAFFFEPGHCALVGVFLLFANRFKIKSNFYLIPIFLSVLFSLSLAGYVLIIVGLLFLNITKFRTILFITVMIVAGYIFVSFIWNDGENPVNELIVARLEYDEEGGIKGNNRAYMDTESVLKKATEHNEIWTGIGNDRFNSLFNHSIAGSGYKIFLLQYGIIGMLLVGLMYYSYSLTATRDNKHFAVLFLLFIGLTFLQRCYTFWFSWQLPFICSIALSHKYESINNLILPKSNY